MVQECPKCKLVNPPTAERCDCGYDFLSRSMNQPHDPEAAEARRKKQQIGYIGGIVGFTIMTINGAISTANPAPDGRLLNTAPLLGFDIWLVIGLLGIVLCLVALVRAR